VTRTPGPASSWLHLWRSRPVELDVPQPPAQALQALDRRLGHPDAGAHDHAGHRTKGRVSDDGRVVLYAARPGRGNGWLRVLRGRVESRDGGGSRVVGRFRATRFARVLLAFGTVALALVAALSAAGVIVGIARGKAVATPLEALAVSGLMLLAWCGMTTWGMRQSFAAEDTVLRWLDDVLGTTADARPAPRADHP
jgi:hypothetical protein